MRALIQPLRFAGQEGEFGGKYDISRRQSRQPEEPYALQPDLSATMPLEFLACRASGLIVLARQLLGRRSHP
jgi:hypothetical protein